MNSIQNMARPLICAIMLIGFGHGRQASAQIKDSLSFTETQSANPHHAESWRTTIKQELPFFGDRNWILIADSAYPLQTSPGVETI